MPDQSAIATLNRLLEVCRDGEMGFASAAEHVTDEGLKWMFQGAARRRGEFAEQLKAEIRRLGGAPAEGGSFAGSAHRSWIDVKGALGGHRDAAILAEAARGEDRALHAYDGALATSLTPSAESLVRTQAKEVRDMHDRVKALEEEWRRRQ